MRAIDKAKQLFLRLTGALWHKKEPAPGLREQFEKELERARSAEASEYQAAALAEMVKFLDVPEDHVFIQFPVTCGYPETVLGPFVTPEEAKEYMRIKLRNQRPNHQEYFSSYKDAPPRHDGDLFVIGGAKIVSKAAVADFKMAAFLAQARGIAFDRNLWEVETRVAMGLMAEDDPEAPPVLNGVRVARRAPTLADAVTVVLHSPPAALKEDGDAPAA